MSHLTSQIELKLSKPLLFIFLTSIILCAVLECAQGQGLKLKASLPNNAVTETMVWMPLAHYDPRHVEPSGRETSSGGEPIYLVRIKTEDGSKIAAMASPKEWLDKVKFSYMGKDTFVYDRDYEKRDVQFLWWPTGTLSWVYGHGTTVPRKMKVSTGSTKGRGGSVPAYICRCFAEEGTKILRIGVWTEGQEGCLIPMGGEELLKPHFEILVINEMGVTMNILSSIKRV